MAGEGEGAIIKSEKPVAKDGSQRGLARKGTKNRATKLLEEMQSVVEKKYGIKDFDPVVMLAVIGCEAMEDRPVIDPDTGKPKTDKDGQPIIIFQDRNLAMSAFAKCAPFVRSTLKQVELTEGDGTDSISADTLGAKKRLALMAKLTDDATTGDEEGQNG